MSRPVRIAEPPPRFPLAVQAVEELADAVYRIRLEAPPFSWQPGDGVGLHAEDPAQSRPYSFSGPADAGYCEFWVRRFPDGVVSRFLTDRSPGDQVEVSPPFGWFRPREPANGTKLFLATGTGIAPFLSALASGPLPGVRVLWGMRRTLPIPGALRDVPLERFVSREEAEGCRRGRVTDALSSLDLSSNPRIYLCGLDRMIEDAAARLRERGVPDDRIHRECFFTSPSSSYAR